MGFEALCSAENFPNVEPRLLQTMWNVNNMKIAFETIGNAILICHDNKPVLATDPWITGDAYFGSWCLSHEIPNEQMQAIKNCEYIWLSHGHPDHLHEDSLRLLKGKKVLLPDHFGRRIFNSLVEQGYEVHVLKDKTWQRLSEHIKILCLSDYNQDACLLVDINGRLIINMNDGAALGWTTFVKNVIGKYDRSFYLRLYGFGNADMINVFNERGDRLLPDPEALIVPLGPQIARDTDFLGATDFVPFSSFHRYQRSDSVWAETYSPSVEDYEKSFESRSSQCLPAFIQYNCATDEWKKLEPAQVCVRTRAPEEFGDCWHEQLEQSDLAFAKKYFKSFAHIASNLDFINLRVGGKDNVIEFSGSKFEKGLTFQVPRRSLMTAVEYEIFDDILIGNFAKTILHGKWERHLNYSSPLYPDFTPYIAKYGDNGRARSQHELASYFRAYRRRMGVRGILDLLVGKLENRSKAVFRSFVAEDSRFYGVAKILYCSTRKSF